MLTKSSFVLSAPSFIRNIVGCAPSAPDGISPRGYSRIFSGIGSKNEFSFADLFVSFHQFFVDFLGHHQYSDRLHQTFFGMVSLLVSTTVIVLSSRYSNVRDVINTITLFVIVN
jgi:hypothetical protein